MRAVTKDESEHSLERWKEWAAKPIVERKAKGERKGPGEWIFSEEEMAEARKWNGDWENREYKSWDQQKAEIEKETQRYYEEQYGLKDSLTPVARQLNWKTPTEFLLCPQKGQECTLQAYIWAISSKEKSSQGRNMATEARFWMQDIIPRKVLSMFLPIRKTP